MDITHRDYYQPWRTIDRFHRDADALWRLLRPPVARARNVSEWVPAVDIKEEEARFLIRADVPGVDAADLDITMTDGVLSVQGKRESRKEDNEAGYGRTERIHGRFKRSFSLPDTADPNRIEAGYQNGVLEISIPKQEPAEPRRIEIKAS